MFKNLIPRLQSLSRRLFRSSHEGGEWGTGAGKGGGAGGSVRDAGGIFGKMQVAYEEEYFRKLQREQIRRLKESMNEEVYQHEEAIKQLQKEIDRHCEKLQKLKHSTSYDCNTAGQRNEKLKCKVTGQPIKEETKSVEKTIGSDEGEDCHKIRREQALLLKEHLAEEISHHENYIKILQGGIDRQKEKIKKLMEEIEQDRS